MFAKKEPKNPIVTYPKQGLAENRYTADGIVTGKQIGRAHV